MKHIKLSEINSFIQSNEDNYYWIHQINSRHLYIVPLPHPSSRYYRDNEGEIDIRVYYVKSYLTLVAIITVVDGSVMLAVTSNHYSQTTSKQLTQLINTLRFDSICYREHDWLENKLNEINKELEKKNNKYINWRNKNR